MLKKYRLKIIGEWWFGSDILDLYRSLLVSGNKTNNYNYFLKKNILKSIDSLQQILDKSHQCNEVHIIAKKIK